MAKGVIVINVDGNKPTDVDEALEVVAQNGLHVEGEATYDASSGIISLDGNPWVRLNVRRIIPFFAGSSLWGKPTSEPE